MTDRLKATIHDLECAMVHEALSALELNQIRSVRDRLRNQLAMEEADQAACHAEEADPDYD